MTSNINQYDVAIVGFGLIGQICAKVCSQYNLRTLVIESKSDTEFSSKAVSFDDESLRLLENVGLYDALKVFLNKPDFTDIVLTNGKVIQRNPVLLTDNDFPSICTFFQPEIEKIIREKLNYKNKIFFKLMFVSSVLSAKRYFSGTQKLGIKISQAVIPKSQ